jgi:uncharacterized membrane protein
MASPPKARRGYLDWLRGIAVLIMVEAHTVDSWTRVAAHGRHAYAWALIVGCFGAPLFLFLAGVAVPLSAGSKLRRFGNARQAVAAVVSRGLEIFILAFLFRLQSFLLSPGSTVLGLFKVDILNIMGPAIVLAALLWWAGRTSRGRLLVFSSATLLIALATPIIRSSRLLDFLPIYFTWYLRPMNGHTNFTMLPWSGFVFAGAVIGVLLDDAREPRRERTVNLGVLAIGIGLTAVGVWAARQPAIYAHSEFWTTSPSFFAIRVGVMSIGLAAVYWLTSYLPVRAWSYPVRRFNAAMEVAGRESLFIYWIHVEMVYGLLTRPIHHQFALPVTLIACAIFIAFLYAIVLVKNRTIGPTPFTPFTGRQRVESRQAPLTA